MNLPVAVQVLMDQEILMDLAVLVVAVEKEAHLEKEITPLYLLLKEMMVVGELPYNIADQEVVVPEVQESVVDLTKCLQALIQREELVQLHGPEILLKEQLVAVEQVDLPQVDQVHVVMEEQVANLSTQTFRVQQEQQIQDLAEVALAEAVQV